MLKFFCLLLVVMSCRMRQSELASQDSGLRPLCGGLGDCSTVIAGTFVWRANIDSAAFERFLVIEPGNEGPRSFRWSEIVISKKDQRAQIHRGKGSLSAPELAVFQSTTHSCGPVDSKRSLMRRIHRSGSDALALRYVEHAASLAAWQQPIQGDSAAGLLAEQYVPYVRVSEAPQWNGEGCF